ncbi:hypothetical protein SODALDRAFT_50040 [Sodiomyces alkalinus F11]|uniref:Uncharacterized protein n=1 Tax=Sodiomyces alkalinus (strain CBS 110278 / VKM F-3762 / F11) TaxID=1314773 RepID=A0A3N2PMG7_SODAK|nr:hypothetical protein SODALDRAFT_50040 [Sodiomyces alkalinus F11]ROT35731.1 hypothetical protein SODALDRAFT_50040 [Sodiomyces alkalinus F11]
MGVGEPHNVTMLWCPSSQEKQNSYDILKPNSHFSIPPRLSFFSLSSIPYSTFPPVFPVGALGRRFHDEIVPSRSSSWQSPRRRPMRHCSYHPMRAKAARYYGTNPYQIGRHRLPRLCLQVGQQAVCSYDVMQNPPPPHPSYLASCVWDTVTQNRTLLLHR